MGEAPSWKRRRIGDNMTGKTAFRGRRKEKREAQGHKSEEKISSS